jgi:hypothetical protein
METLFLEYHLNNGWSLLTKNLNTGLEFGGTTYRAASTICELGCKFWTESCFFRHEDLYTSVLQMAQNANASSATEMDCPVNYPITALHLLLSAGHEIFPSGASVAGVIVLPAIEIFP